MFHVPHHYRMRTHPTLGSDDAIGNNGAFLIPYKGYEFTVIASDGAGWEHVSVSLPQRAPTWDHMCFVKGLFWDDEDCVLQYHPPRSVYVNCCRTCLHLWRPVRPDGKPVVVPIPDPELVGPRR